MGSALVAAGSFSPLDEELELLPGSLTPGLEEVLVRLGSWMPFAQAQQLLLDWMKLDSLSEATVRRHTEGAGAAYVAIQEEEAKLKPRWDVHLPWCGHRAGSRSGMLRPLIATPSGSAVSPRLSGWSAR